MPETILPLNQLLLKNIGLHIIIENEVRLTPFGQITFNIKLTNEVADLTTINVVKQRRRRYDLTKNDSSTTI